MTTRARKANHGDVIVVVRGTGSAGHRHLRALRANPGVHAVAYPIRAQRVAELRAEGFPAVATLAEVNGATGAIVATDTGRHLADARELLPVGDLLVEKPLAPTVDGLPELARLAASLDRRVWVAFCLRFDPSLHRFGELLPSIGAVDSVRIECQSYLPEWRPNDHRRSYSARRDEGGVLRDLAHEIDYAVHFFGRPAHVFALLGNTGRLEIEAEEWADLTWTVPRGAVVSLRLDYLSRVSRRRMRAIGAEGELEWDALTQSVTLRRAGAADVVETATCTRDEMFTRQAAAFVRGCSGGESDPLATLEEGAFVAALTDSARRSASTGRLEPIQVPRL